MPGVIGSPAASLTVQTKDIELGAVGSWTGGCVWRWIMLFCSLVAMPANASLGCGLSPDDRACPAERKAGDEAEKAGAQGNGDGTREGAVENGGLAKDGGELVNGAASARQEGESVTSPLPLQGSSGVEDESGGGAGDAAAQNGNRSEGVRRGDGDGGAGTGDKGTSARWSGVHQGSTQRDSDFDELLASYLEGSFGERGGSLLIPLGGLRLLRCGSSLLRACPFFGRPV